MVDHRWILFTDLDGTLLDKETYEPGPSLGALGRCRDAGIHVIFSSSKTGAEIRLYHERYAFHPGSPFIAENGGGVFFPLDHWDKPPGGEETERFWKATRSQSRSLPLRSISGPTVRPRAPASSMPA